MWLSLFEREHSIVCSIDSIDNKCTIVPTVHEENVHLLSCALRMCIESDICACTYSVLHRAAQWSHHESENVNVITKLCTVEQRKDTQYICISLT